MANLLSAIERTFWRINKYTNTKIIVEQIDFKVITPPKSKDFSLIIQGPIEKENLVFFINMIESYLTFLNPIQIIVVSSSIMKEAEDKLSRLKVRYVKVDYNPCGLGNISVQSRSVFEGIKYCTHELLVKTRTDQFIQRWDFIDAYLKEVRNDKLFICGYTLSYPKFHIGDMLHYGKKNLISKVWGNTSSIEYINLASERYFQLRTSIKKDFVKSGEIYVGISIADTYNIDINESGAYEKMLIEKTIICSNSDIGLQWAKHNSIADFHRHGSNGFKPLIDHMSWLSLSKI